MSDPLVRPRLILSLGGSGHLESWGLRPSAPSDSAELSEPEEWEINPEHTTYTSHYNINQSSHLGIHKQTNGCWSLESQPGMRVTPFIANKNCNTRQ